MAESSFKLNIKTSADVGGISQAQQALGGLADDATKVGDDLREALGDDLADQMEELKRQLALASGALDQVGEKGEAAGQKLGQGLNNGASQGFNLTQVIDVPNTAQDAWRIGSQIGGFIAKGLESMSKGQGFIAGIFGDYDPANDAGLQKMKASLGEILDELRTPPKYGLLEYLEDVVTKAREAADEIKHLAELREIDSEAEKAGLDDERAQRKKAIEADESMPPEAKAEAVAEIEREQINADYERERGQRIFQESDALDEQDRLAAELAEAKRIEEEARRRAEVAAEAGRKAEGAWRQTDEGKARGEQVQGYVPGVGVVNHPKLAEATPMPEGYAKNFVANEGTRRGMPGLGSAEEEMAAVEAAKKMREELEGKGRNGALQGERMREKQAAEEAAAEAERARKLRDVDERRSAAAPPPAADPGKLDAAADAATVAAADVGKSAEKLAATTADSSQQIAGDMRQMAGDLDRSLGAIQAAVAANSQAIMAISQRTEQVAQAAAAALNATADLRNGNRPYNR